MNMHLRGSNYPAFSVPIALENATTTEAVHAALIHLQGLAPPDQHVHHIRVQRVNWREDHHSKPASKGTVDWQSGGVSLLLVAEMMEGPPEPDTTFTALLEAVCEELLEVKQLRGHIESILND